MFLRFSLIAIPFALFSCKAVESHSTHSLQCQSANDLLRAKLHIRIIRNKEVLAKIRNKELSILYDQILSSVLLDDTTKICIPKEIDLVVRIDKKQLRYLNAIPFYLDETTLHSNLIKITMNPTLLGDLISLPMIESVEL
jgi:hypothetical protein